MEAGPLRRCPRLLTFDEKRAAEAAFAGQPACVGWSEAGRRVYEGLMAVLTSRATERLSHDCERLAMGGVR